ncbi:MAG: type VI secretion system tip protein VgrG [Polyangiaceae bacterium]|nr:type VI secretion system tip protein VgrG [Polyangiaceae bacterium]
MADAVDVLKFTFEVDGLLPALNVARFGGREALSELFRFDLTLTSTEGAIAFADVIGKPARLTLQAGEQQRFVHGIVSRFEQCDEGKNVTVYEAVLVPRAYRLLHRHDARIFQDLTVPQIIEKVLQAAGLTSADYKILVNGEYAPREYCVQYRESDWAFICRLMEHEGMVCFFEHDHGGHVLTFGDSPYVHTPISGDEQLTFRPPAGAMAHGEHVSRFRYAEEVRPGKTTLRDYEFKRPELLLQGDTEDALDRDLEVYDYPGYFNAPKPGEDLSKIRLEQWRSVSRAGRGESACVRFLPGHLFGLSEHPRDAFNQRWLLTAVQHTGTQPQMAEAGAGGERSYRNDFLCAPEGLPFRPLHRTPRPTIKGPQTAIVVGPAGEEIYTDEHGRVKVQFHWDRLGKRDEKSSCWIRVSQGWAGSAWGAMYIPRIGHEVVVEFLEGDPDRPLIVGRVYHGANVPPYPLPAEKTKSTLKSNSSPGGDGYNELRFEDKKGAEEIFLHAQKDWNIEVLHDKTQHVGNNEELRVDANRDKSVGVDESQEVGQDRTTSVGRDSSESVGRDETIKVGGDRTEDVAGSEKQTIGKDRSESVGGSHTETIAGDMSLSVGADKTEKVSGKSEETVSGDKNVSVDGSYSIAVSQKMSTTVGGDLEEDVQKNKKVTVGEKYELTCGDGKVTVEKNGNITIEGKDITIKGSGNIVVEAGGKIAIKSGGPVDLEASGAVTVKASSVSMN